MSRIGRNEPCPCGSGLKFKHCCLNRPDRASMYMRILMGIAILVLLAGVAIAFLHEPGEQGRRVWSAEHGHWHDVP